MTQTKARRQSILMFMILVRLVVLFIWRLWILKWVDMAWRFRCNVTFIHTDRIFQKGKSLSFYMSNGFLGYVANWSSASWTTFSVHFNLKYNVSAWKTFRWMWIELGFFGSIFMNWGPNIKKISNIFTKRICAEPISSTGWFQVFYSFTSVENSQVFSVRKLTEIKLGKISFKCKSSH